MIYIETVFQHQTPQLEASIFQIPVFKGAVSPLIDWDEHYKNSRKPFFGEDGFGCADPKNIPRLEVEQKENAVAALNNLASEHKGEYKIIETP